MYELAQPVLSNTVGQTVNRHQPAGVQRITLRVENLEIGVGQLATPGVRGDHTAGHDLLTAAELLE